MHEEHRERLVVFIVTDTVIFFVRRALEGNTLHDPDACLRLEHIEAFEADAPEDLIVVEAAVRVNAAILNFTLGALIFMINILAQTKEVDAFADDLEGHELVGQPALDFVVRLTHIDWLIAEWIQDVVFCDLVELYLVLLHLTVEDGLHGKLPLAHMEQMVARHIERVVLVFNLVALFIVLMSLLLVVESELLQWLEFVMDLLNLEREARHLLQH